MTKTVLPPASPTLDEVSAAEYLGVAAATLRNWRSRCQGPPYLRVGRRRLYAIDDLNHYLAAVREDPCAVAS